ncbi:LytR C-terminal domain-containing protein [Streptomyces sp. NPDC059740]|uniref:LytR C-terminal domain-containing protein n=1 Tax=Streptomyces sp. NPDC059740 TaxID=3346926 RepID=UPI00364A8240
MSMLTPPGMGGKRYRITGDRYPRMRRPSRRRRLAVAAAAAVCALGVAGWGVVQLLDVFGGEQANASATSGASCHPGQDDARPAADKPGSSPAALPRPHDVTVNVLNATDREGLAKKTADALKKRGFTIGEVGNAPAAYDGKVKDAAVLLGGPAAARGPLKVLGVQVTGALSRSDHRKGGDVDLILGEKFTDLTDADTAGSRLTALTHPTPARTSKAHAGC